MMKHLVAVLVVVSFATCAAMAELDATPVAVPKVKEPSVKELTLKELTLKGTIEKTEKKDGEAVVAVKYTLAGTDSKVELPAPAKSADEAAVINLDEFVDQEVEVVAKGVELEKDGVKTIKVKEVISVKKVEAEVAVDKTATPAKESCCGTCKPAPVALAPDAVAVPDVVPVAQPVPDASATPMRAPIVVPAELVKPEPPAPAPVLPSTTVAPEDK